MSSRDPDAGSPASLGTPGSPPPEPDPWARRFGRGAERLLRVGGIATLAACALALLEASLYQGHQNRRLEQLRREGAAGGRSSGAVGHRPYGRIEIPRLGLSAIIREGIDPHTLLIAVGHVPGTALPGEDGNAVLTGHRDTFFRRLAEVRLNDAIRIVTPDEVYDYRVDDTHVTTPDRTEVLAPTAAPTLTLITCYPFTFIGPAPRRFIVRARQLPQPARPVV